MRIVTDKSKDTVCVIVDRGVDDINYSIWNELLCSEELSDFDCNISVTAEKLEMSYSLRNGELVLNCADRLTAENALMLLSDFARFVYCEENNKHYILGVNNVFYDGTRLRFIKNIVSFEQSKSETVRFFLKSLIFNNPEISSDVSQRLLDACMDKEQMPEALINKIQQLVSAESDVADSAEEPASDFYEMQMSETAENITEDANEEVCNSDADTEDIFQMAQQLENENDLTGLREQEEQPEAVSGEKICPSCGSVYRENYVFCVKCGQLLHNRETPSVEKEPENNNYEPENTVQEIIANNPPPPIHGSESSGSVFEETTLLGFTNFGETSILGGGMNASYDMPNLIRVSTGEKIFITKRNYVIGKSKEKADYAVLNNNAISRIHAEIIVSGNEYYIVDKGSTNHTYVNNSMVNKESSVRIFDGDEIKLADEVFIFKLQ